MHETDTETRCRFGDCHAEVTIVLAETREPDGSSCQELKRACTNPACRSNTGRARHYERV